MQTQYAQNFLGRTHTQLCGTVNGIYGDSMSGLNESLLNIILCVNIKWDLNAQINTQQWRMFGWFARTSYALFACYAVDTIWYIWCVRCAQMRSSYIDLWPMVLAYRRLIISAFTLHHQDAYLHFNSTRHFMVSNTFDELPIQKPWAACILHEGDYLNPK